MEIVKVMKESMPDVKLIGKRYTDKDRDEHGTFARYWQQWFGEGLFDALCACKSIPGVSEDSFGLMRMTEDGFEYWIGALFAPDSDVPGGYDTVAIPAGNVGVCWLRGNDKNGEMYSMEASDMAMKALTKSGMSFADDGWFFERYNKARFTQPDENGFVILDIGTYLIG